MKKTKLDKNGLAPCNGRPQLYHSFTPAKSDRFRIVHPSGMVEYCFSLVTDDWTYWLHGCTSRTTQRAALRAIAGYSRSRREDLLFLGYL